MTPGKGPTKGERTRERIVAAAAPLFNQRGYVGASMADLMAATGLEKGGIYRHFESKDALALAAFDHAIALHGSRIAEVVEPVTGAVARLTAFGAAMASIAESPSIPGGCPILNTAVESDDGDDPVHLELRARARHAMRRLIGYVRRILEAGVASGELRDDVTPQAEAEQVVASMEGAIVLAKLYADPRYVRDAAARVARHAESLAASGAASRAHISNPTP
jgi:AcrR family transcriptional regulator